MAGREPAGLTERTEEDLQRLVMGGSRWSVLCIVRRHTDGSSRTAEESSEGPWCRSGAQKAT